MRSMERGGGVACIASRAVRGVICIWGRCQPAHLQLPLLRHVRRDTCHDLIARCVMCIPSSHEYVILQDPTEHEDLAPTMPGVRSNLTAALTLALATKYQSGGSGGGGPVPGFEHCVTMEEYVAAHRGFGGPLCYAATPVRGTLPRDRPFAP